MSIYLVFDTTAKSQESRPMLEVTRIRHYFPMNVWPILRPIHRAHGMTCSCSNSSRADNSRYNKYMLIFQRHNSIVASMELHTKYFQLH